jgi:hypothetical protein
LFSVPSVLLAGFGRLLVAKVAPHRDEGIYEGRAADAKTKFMLHRNNSQISVKRYSRHHMVMRADNRLSTSNTHAI